ncbi:NADH-quinone oxidoreductase subunit NuoN [Luteimonas aquatica]|uniref:NADH-quinone oxidoreductase subunit NuoN n=1 Tax=Luteimonas aquatica TaxID=450364 RepID=UPI001F5A9D69|nr:NADH-quinone oxidoreductase subunit NuoN [Luteimonas aquatica]
MTPQIRTLADVAPLAPELTVILGAFALLMLDLFLDDRRRIVTQTLAIGVLLAAAALVFTGTGAQGTEGPISVLNGMFVRDTAADVLKLTILLVSAAALAYGWTFLRERGLFKGEIPVLMLFAVAGMMLLVSAGNLTMVYLGLELLALSSYALVAIDRDSPLSSEAAMKYFVLGALASGMLLYGMSLVYGATRTLDLGGINAAAAAIDGPDRLLLLAGAVFLVVGIAFKFGAAPFHMWLPDTYQGAPTPITLFIGSAPKLAAFGMTYRLLESGVGPLGEYWHLLLAGLAALSLAIGNLLAIAQTNLKRMLAYSTVSHVGFLFLGLASGTAQGYASAMFYAISYAIMSAAAFGAIVLLSRRGFEADRIDDFKGLNARNPWMAGLVLCIMASLAGVPPFLGFWAKLAVLRAALQGDLLWLAIVAIVFAVIGAFYYLRVIKVMYFDEPAGEPLQVRPNRPLRTMFAVNALALLALGLAWSPVMAWCQKAFAA